jgi:hypothetical protein
MARPFKIAQAVAEQVESNRTEVGHAGHFAGHRARLTDEICARAAPAGVAGAGAGPRLCLLGAGNAYDVDLERLAAHFGEIHLADIDRESLQRVRADAAPEIARRLVLHAPVDLSGVFAELERWSASPPEPARFSSIVDAAVTRVVGALPGPFDVVVSCCLLTQIQLALVQVVGDRNPRFSDLRTLLSRIHVRSLARLTAATGRALLVSDLTSSETYPLDSAGADATLLRALMEHLLSVGNVIYAAQPGLLSAEIRRHPEWSAAYEVGAPFGPWLWRNGPTMTFLVYGLEIAPRRPADAPPPG